MIPYRLTALSNLLSNLVLNDSRSFEKSESVPMLVFILLTFQVSHEAGILMLF